MEMNEFLTVCFRIIIIAFVIRYTTWLWGPLYIWIEEQIEKRKK